MSRSTSSVTQPFWGVILVRDIVLGKVFSKEFERIILHIKPASSATCCVTVWPSNTLTTKVSLVSAGFFYV